MTSNMQESMLAMMTDRHVLFAQRVRYFFYVSKDRLNGRNRVGLVKRLDQLMDMALLQHRDWHSHFTTLIAEASELEALHRDDHAFLLGQLERCVADRSERPRETKGRRIGTLAPSRI